MKKTIGRILLMMFLLGLLNSCTTIRMPFGILDLSGDEGKAKQTATKICESINQKDAETLRGMFSENTQKNCPDLEEQVQAMFDVIGECTMTDFGCGGIENITSGVVTKKVLKINSKNKQDNKVKT